MARPRRLDAEEVGRQLVGLPAWTGDVDRLARTLAFPDFRTAIRGVDEIAEVAEEMDHHPDWSNSWNRVTIELWSHDEGAITVRDVALAQRIDAVVDPAGRPRPDGPPRTEPNVPPAP